MPEGHTIHRLARDHARWFAGGEVRVASPQGRFASGAAVLDGAELEGVDAWGKHLLYRFGADRTLHVHLGLFGRFRMRRRPAHPPRSPPRMVLANEAREVRLSGPTACELLTDDQVAALEARLGPDPLRADGTAEAFLDRVAGRRKAAGAVLLDQSILAGIGNVYRAELLFLEGLHPEVPASTVPPEAWRRIWARAAVLLDLGVRLNRIVTVDPAERGKRHARELRRGERHYVYKRTSCLRCGARIVRTEVANRTSHHCPGCQPGVVPSGP